MSNRREFVESSLGLTVLAAPFYRKTEISDDDLEALAEYLSEGPPAR